MRGTSRSRLFLPFAALLIGLAGIAASSTSAAAQNSLPDRITAVISNTSRSVIPGSISPRVSLAADLGPTSGQTLLQGMSLRFTPSPAQQAALDQLLADQQNPASPRFRQWLTPPQYAAQFGLSGNDIAKVTAWLASQGFTVTAVANGGTFITFDGTVAQVQIAFATSIHSLSVNGESHFANVTEPSVPSAFAAVVGAVTGMHDFRVRPHLRTSIVKPNFTSSLSGNHFLAPGDLYTIYDMNALLASSAIGTAGTGSYTGAGIGTGPINCKSVPPSGSPTNTPQPTCGDIAVMGAVDIVPSDISAFRSASGLSSTNLPTTVHEGTDPGPSNGCNPGGPTVCPTGPNNDDLAESSIDLEWAGAMAPSANILFVNGKDIFNNSIMQAIDQNLAPILTISYGECEAGWGSSILASTNTLFKQANAQGQTILAAAGDEGATDCDPQTVSAASQGLAVDFPASSPYVTAMGGTMFSGDAEASGSGTTWNSTQYWKGASGSDVVSSAVAYIPEVPWSDLSYGYFGGGGGGVSAFFPKPAWQVETGASGMMTSIPSDGARDVPDISLTASDLHDPFLFCVNGSCGNGFRIASGTNASDLTPAGGTSFDSQIFGGMLALVEQKVGARFGNINPTLYALGNKTAYYNSTGSLPGGTSVFHDVTAGSNAMPCVSGTVECPSSLSLGYSAATGYDLATGWGSVDLNNLANDWTLVTPPLGSGTLAANLTATSLVASTYSVAAGSTVTLTASPVSLTANFTPGPTGTVQFLVNNVAVGSLVTLNSSGVATFAWTPTCSNLGPQHLTAVYSGDSNYQGSIGPALNLNPENPNAAGAFANTPLIVAVSVGSTCPSFSLSGSGGTNTTVTVAAGAAIPPVTITVAPVNGLTGTVMFTASVSDNTGYVPGISFTPAAISIPTVSSTILTLSGISASLRLPNAPGTHDSTIMLAQSPVRTHPWTIAGSGITLASLLLLVLPRRRRLGGLLLLALSVALALGATGCGGSSQSGPPATTPPTTSPYAGTYTVNVIGTYTGSGSANIPPQSTIVTYVIN